MNKLLQAIALLTLVSVSAFAHEYPLQFTAGAGARGLVVAGYQTTALARSQMLSTDCVAVLAPGSSCSIAIYYDPTQLAYPTGLMYDTLTVTVESNSPQAAIYSSRFTIQVRVGENDD